jgi:hypothetical protein
MPAGNPAPSRAHRDWYYRFAAARIGPDSAACDLEAIAIATVLVGDTHVVNTLLSGATHGAFHSRSQLTR